VPQIPVSGGSFQNISGNPLANGWLEFELSHDVQDTTLSAQVVGGITLKILLDNNGNAAADQTIETTDTMNPTAYYTVMAYNSDGTRSWKAPQYVSVPSSPSPFNLGTIIPSNPPAQSSFSGQGILLQTNGVNNSDQSLLNLQEGSGVTLSNSDGTTTISASGGGAVISTAGQGFFFGPGITSVNASFINLNETAEVSAGTNNAVLVFQFTLFGTYTISTISTVIFTGATSALVSYGIYDATGTNLLLNSGTFSASSTGTKVNTITPVTLNPGVYWFAQTSSSGTVQSLGTSQQNSGTATGWYYILLNTNYPRSGQAANSSSSGVLPSSLGTITGYTSGTLNGQGICLPLFEP
jgi:hypothetical protein